MIVLGCKYVVLVGGQDDPVAPVTPAEGPVDIGGDCVVIGPCVPWEQFGYYAHPTNCSEYFQCESFGSITRT